MKENNQQLRANTRATPGGIDVVVTLAVAGVFWGFVVRPFMLDLFAGTDTTAWSGGAVAMWSIFSMVIVMAIFLYAISVGKSVANK